MSTQEDSGAMADGTSSADCISGEEERSPLASRVPWHLRSSEFNSLPPLQQVKLASAASQNVSTRWSASVAMFAWSGACFVAWLSAPTLNLHNSLVYLLPVMVLPALAIRALFIRRELQALVRRHRGES